jgi:hypothetical protein
MSKHKEASQVDSTPERSRRTGRLVYECFRIRKDRGEGDGLEDLLGERSAYRPKPRRGPKEGHRSGSSASVSPSLPQVKEGALTSPAQ